MPLGLTRDRRRRGALGRRQPLGHALLAGLVEWWPLSERSGTRRGVHAGLHMGLGTDPGLGDGPAGSLAATFNAGSAQYLTRANDAVLQMGDVDFTVCGWAYLTSKSVVYPSILSRDIDTSHREFALIFHQGLDRWNFQTWNASQTVTALTGAYGGAVANNAGSPALNTWYFICAWQTAGGASGGTLNIAVNGGATDSAAQTSTTTAKVTATEMSADLRGTQSRYLSGRLARIGVWRRVLSVDERAWLYNGGCGRDYPFA